MRSNVTIASAASAALLALLVACSSSDEGTSSGTNTGTDGGTGTTTPGTPDGSTPAPTTQTLEAQYAAAECAFLARCYPPFLAENFGDQNGCVTAKSALVAAGFHADATANLAAQVTACAATETARACDGDYLTIPPTCRFQGTRANGTACTHDAQCQSGSCFGAAGACGTCTALAADGADCSAAECQSGSACDDDTKTCVAIPKAGGACGSATGSSYCGVGGTCIDDACSKLGNAGEDCSQSGACAEGLSCADGSTCSEDERVAVGAACGSDEDNVLTGCNDGYCAIASDATLGKCTAWVGEGGDCDDDADPGIFCGEGLSCVAGKCHSSSSARPTTCK